LLHDSGVLFGISTFGIFPKWIFEWLLILKWGTFQCILHPQKIEHWRISRYFSLLFASWVLFLYFLLFLFLFLPFFPWSSLSFLRSVKLASMTNLLAFLGCPFFLLACFLEEIYLPFWIRSKSWSRVACKQPEKKNSNKFRVISRVQMRGSHYCLKHSWQETNEICCIPCRNETRLLPP